MSAPSTPIPWTYEARPDTRTTNVRLLALATGATVWLSGRGEAPRAAALVTGAALAAAFVVLKVLEYRTKGER